MLKWGELDPSILINSFMRLTSTNLFYLQIIVHILTLYWVFNYFNLINLFFVFGVYFFTGCLGMSVTYHRLLTHKSFKTNKVIEFLGTLLATLGLTGSSISWTAAHRQHHRNADKQNDPHSPTILGYFKAQWGSMFSPININKSPIISSSMHRFFHRYYLHINLIYAILLFVLGGLYALLTFYIVPACILWNAGSLINTICHTKWLGYRRYEVPDKSTNNPILGLLMWGEGWHNNHHRFQNRPNIGEKWYEIDIGYYIIKLIGNKHETKT